MKGFGLSKSLLEAAAGIIDEGRGKKGSAKRAGSEYDNEWGDDDSKQKKFTQARGGKREVEEETQIDEISKKTLGSYIKKALDDRDVKMDASDRMHQKGHATAKSGLTKTSDNFFRLADKNLNRAVNRREGIRKATDRLTKESFEDLVIFDEAFGLGEILDINEDSVSVVFEGHIEEFELDEIMFEEVEDLQELSADTLKSYKAKAEAQVGEKKRGKPSAATIAMRAKRTAGIGSAKEKLQKIHDQERKERRESRNSHQKELHDHFHNEAPKILAKHGFTKAADGPTHATWVKPTEHGHLSTVTLAKRMRNYGDSDEPRYDPADHKLSSSTGWSGHTHPTHDHYSSHDIHTKEGKDSIKREMMPKFESAVIDHHNRVIDHAARER